VYLSKESRLAALFFVSEYALDVKVCYNIIMLNKAIKFSFSALVIVGALWFLAGGSGGNLFVAENKTPDGAAPVLRVYFLDVGQGDAIYIRTPDEQDVLIDGGPDASVLSELGKVMPFWDREIDVMILTHPHSDHVAGLVEVLRRFEVKQIYYTGVLHTAPDYLAWLEEIKTQKIPLNIVQDFFELKLSDSIKLQFLFPMNSLVNQKMTELNNSSIVTRLVDGETEFLFTGDAEVEVEEALVKKYCAPESDCLLASDVLKIGHHGSTSSSAEEFLRAVNPRYAVISVGKYNSFGHPHLRTLKRLERLGAQILRTDERRTISFATDGKSLSVE